MVEDSSVDSGGCIIETDFGEIDARISSQLAELEAKILEISPIKSKMKSSAALNGTNGSTAALLRAASESAPAANGTNGNGVPKTSGPPQAAPAAPPTAEPAPDNGT